MKAIIVSGTDTDVGKTVISAMLARALNGFYWKPIQSGSPLDSARVAALGLPPAQILPEAFRLTAPLSPHQASAQDGIAIDTGALMPPAVPQGHPLIIEGAGGLLVPITETLLQIDLFARWKAPVVLVARTKLGTINHTLLSVEALQKRGIALLGILFSGDAQPETERVIARLSSAHILGRLPVLNPLDPQTLMAAFATHFKSSDFEQQDG